MSEENKIEEVASILEEVKDVVNSVTEIRDIKLEIEVKKTEETKEEIKEEIKEIVALTFVQLFENFLSEDLTKFSVKLTPEIQQYFLLLCKEKPDLFGEFEKSLKQIILDNKIDTKDIPEILVLVNKVHKILKETQSFQTIDPYEIIKLFLHSIFIVYIETNKIENKDLIENILKIVDVAIDLVKLVPLKKNGGCLFKCGI